MHQLKSQHEYGAYGLFLLVTIFLMIYLILTFYNPEFVQRKVHGKATQENDVILSMIWAFVLTIIILFVLCLLWYAFTCL